MAMPQPWMISGASCWLPRLIIRTSICEKGRRLPLAFHPCRDLGAAPTLRADSPFTRAAAASLTSGSSQSQNLWTRLALAAKVALRPKNLSETLYAHRARSNERPATATNASGAPAAATTVACVPVVCAVAMMKIQQREAATPLRKAQWRCPMKGMRTRWM